MRRRAAALVIASAAVIEFIAHEQGTSTASASQPLTIGGTASHALIPSRTTPTSAPAPVRELPKLQPHVAVGTADGVVPDGVTVFDDRYPAVARLNPDLLRALRAAATDAERDGITFFVNSGWRSVPYQNELLRQAVAQYGSEQEAARWVATAKTSAHVKGEAVDIGHTGAANWLSRNGTAYGLCQIYRNEPWHYELRPSANTDGCPQMYADPTHDPRMQQ